MAEKGRHAQKSHKGLVVFIVIIFVVAILAVGAFVFRAQLIDAYNNIVDNGTTVVTTEPTTEAPTTTVQETTTVPDANYTKASEMVAKMGQNEKICQLFVVTPEVLTGVDVATVAGDTTKKQLTKYPVGGIVYFEQNKADDDSFEEMVSNTKSYAKTPLFIMENGEKTVFAYSDELNAVDVSKAEKSDGSECVEAFTNNAQVILMPQNLSKSVAYFAQAVKDGKIQQSAIDEAVTQILKVKIEKGIIE
jgi:beta-N-acetylhexosaminidase